MINLPEIREKILDDKDKILFNEAATCFEHKLYRSAYIILWICIAESLKRKLVYLSANNNVEAREAVEEIETLERNEKSADSTILTKAKSIGIIQNSDFPTLHSFYINRSVYAHPYNIAPIEADVEYILIKSVDCVLSKETLLGKTYIEEVINTYLTQRHFLNENITDIDNYVTEVLSKVKESLHPFMYKTLFFEISKAYESKENYWMILRYRRFVIEIFKRNENILIDETMWTIENQATKYPEIAIFSFVYFETWQILPENVKEILIRFLSHMLKKNELKNHQRVCSVLNNLRKSGFLKTEEQIVIDGIFDSLSYIQRFTFFDDNEKWQFIVKNIESDQYTEQNMGFDLLKNNLEKLNWQIVSNDTLFQLGKGLCFCLIFNNWKGSDMFKLLEQNKMHNASPSIQGYVYEIFLNTPTERNAVYFFKTHKLFEKSTSLLSKLTELEVTGLGEKISNDLEGKKPILVSPSFMEEFEKAFNNPKELNLISFYNSMRDVYQEKIEEDIQLAF